MTRQEAIEQATRMGYVHPYAMTPAQNRENTARVLDRLAAVHERLATGALREDQLANARSARRAAKRIRDKGRANQ